MTFEVIFLAKSDFEIFWPAVILPEGLTLDASRALLRHKNFDGKTKISKIKKDEDWVGWPSGSLNKSFEVIFLAKMDFQNFCSSVIPSEGLTLEASRVLLRHEDFDGKSKISKIEKDEQWVG